MFHRTVPSSPPLRPFKDEIGPTCVEVIWWPPEQRSSSLSHYEMSYVSSVGSGSITTQDYTTTFAGVCVPLTDVTYRFEVVAVSVAGGVVARSVPTHPLYHSCK